MDPFWSHLRELDVFVTSHNVAELLPSVPVLQGLNLKRHRALFEVCVPACNTSKTTPNFPKVSQLLFSAAFSKVQRASPGV